MTEFEQLAVETAKAHGLDPAVVQAVCEQESSWNSWAYRFEPAFKARYVDPLNVRSTEAIGRSTSWGLMQLMGQVARELGYEGDLPALCDPKLGLEWGCKHLARKLEGVDLHTGLQKWNGGGNLDYASQVMGRMAKYAGSL